MTRPKRSIEDILHFRDDISPFLIHMTKNTKHQSARQVLESILDSKTLIAGSSPVSAAVYARSMDRNDRNWMFKHEFDSLASDIKECFRAICFSETPLRFSHCLFDIASRKINLEPYGIVLIKKRMQDKGVSPVLYLNNYTKDKDPMIDLLAKLVYSDRALAKEFVPLLGFAGEFMNSSIKANHDFQWEREWRYPASKSELILEDEDIFLGLCPMDEIEDLESKYPGISFIDPMIPLEYFATKLIACRRRSNLKYSIF